MGNHMSVPEGELELRWKRLRERAAAGGFDGLLVFSNQINQTYIHYVANYTLLGDRSYFFLPLAGEPTLLIGAAWDLQHAVLESGLSDVRPLTRGSNKEIISVMKAGTKGKTAVAGMEMLNEKDLAEFKTEFGDNFVQGTDLLEEVALVKTDFELGLIRKAAEMADAAFLKVVETAKEGMLDYYIMAEIDYTMKKMGATDNFQMSSIGRDSTGMLLPYGKKLEKGDIFLFEMTPAYRSVTYSAQLCRTAVYGELPPLFYEKYDILVRALEESLKIIKPGARIADVAKIQNDIISKAGYAEYCRPPYMRSRGHGFGLGRVEVDDECPLTFQKNMSIVIHPNQFIPETGYLALGDHIIVTETGFERLLKTKPMIYTCGGGNQ